MKWFNFIAHGLLQVRIHQIVQCGDDHYHHKVIDTGHQICNCMAMIQIKHPPIRKLLVAKHGLDKGKNITRLSKSITSHYYLVALVVSQGGSPSEHPGESMLSSAEKRWPRTQSAERTRPEMVKVLSVLLVAMKFFFWALSLQLLSCVQVYLFRSDFVEILYYPTVVCFLD